MKKKSGPGSRSSDISQEPERLRRVIRTPPYEEAIRKIVPSVARAAEVLMGLEDFVSRRPELGMAVRGYPSDQFASWLSKPLPGQGRIRVTYHFDAVVVTLLDAWIVPEQLEGQFF